MFHWVDCQSYGSIVCLWRTASVNHLFLHPSTFPFSEWNQPWWTVFSVQAWCQLATLWHLPKSLSPQLLGPSLEDCSQRGLGLPQVPRKGKPVDSASPPSPLWSEDQGCGMPSLEVFVHSMASSFFFFLGPGKCVMLTHIFVGRLQQSLLAVLILLLAAAALSTCFAYFSYVLFNCWIIF